MLGNQFVTYVGQSAFGGEVCGGVAGNQPEQLWGGGGKSIREFFTKIHQTPWDTSIIYIPIIPLFERFSTFWHVILDEKRRR